MIKKKITLDQSGSGTNSRPLSSIFPIFVGKHLEAGISKHFAGLMFIIGFSVLIAFLAFNREFFTYGTETDYLGGFVPEAQRFINGNPLLVEFHPPFYSITLAVVQQIFSDWFVTGLVVSL